MVSLSLISEVLKQNIKIASEKVIKFNKKGIVIMANMTSNMAEALENSKAAAVSTRGIYPVTKASHVYKEDGTPLETPEEVEEGSSEVDAG